MNPNPDLPAGGLTAFRERAYSWGKDAFERAAWTAIETAVGVVTVELADVPLWVAVPVGTGLAAVKAYAAKHLALKGTASTAPGL